MDGRWTAEEDRVLSEEYPQGRVWSAAACRRLPGRSDHAVSSRAARIGLTKQAILPWFSPMQKGRLPRGVASRAHARRVQRRR